MGQIFTGDVGDAGVVSQVTGHGERGAAVAEEAAWGGVMAADPWLFSERDVRLMRLKKPLFLDSRFLSDPSWVLVDEPFPEGILEMIKMRKSKFIQSQKWIWCQTCSNYKKTLTNMTNWIWEMITLMSQKKGKQCLRLFDFSTWSWTAVGLENIQSYSCLAPDEDEVEEIQPIHASATIQNSRGQIPAGHMQVSNIRKTSSSLYLAYSQR